MKKFKTLFLCAITSFTLISCGPSNTKEKYAITFDQFFEQTEQIYGVYYYKDGCPNCDNVYYYIDEYVKKVDSGKDLLLDKIYCLDAEKNSLNKIDLGDKDIYRSTVLGLTSTENITVMGYPQLFIIEKVNNTNTITSVHIGEKEITNYIKTIW